MGNALLFTACLLGAAVFGGFVGSCCSKGRQAGDHEGRIAELEERLDALADHCMEEDKRLKTDISDVDIRADELHDHYLDLKRIFAEQNERLNECELLIGDPPTEGLLGRVSALEDAQKTHEQDAVIVNGWVEEIEALKLKQETFEHRTLGWQEGFGGEVRKQLKRMDERIAKLEVKGE